MELNPLTRQLLEWILEHPRTYAETMDAWKTSCPRLSVWEDAEAAGLVQVDSGAILSEAPVHLTEDGHRALKLR